MKQQGFFHNLCRSLDCMEEEVTSICRIFCKDKPKKRPCACKEQRPVPDKKIPPDFWPPCGRNVCCCEKEKGK